VADEALSRGFDMVNDICGFADPEMPRVCREHDVAVSKMASPPDLERPGAIEDVDDIYEALSMNGFTDKTILDPAFGGWSAAKTHDDDRETFHRLREFRGYGRPLLVSINRKSFLKTIAGRSTEEALPVSLAATSMAVERGAHVIRTHDVAETRDAALVGAEFARDRYSGGDSGAVAVEELDVTTVREAERHLDRIGAAEATQGDRDAAGNAVVRTYELSGLGDAAVGALRAATVGGDASGAAFALGDPNRAASPSPPSATDGGTGGEKPGGDRRGLLIGTPAAIESVREAVSDVSDPLDAALAGIDHHVS
ncbi:dihydropteroate synthase, partial [Halorubrum sp. E3]